MLLIGMTFATNTMTTPAKAQGYCQIKQTERTLFSHPVTNLNQKIKSVMQSAELEGEVQQIVWADGLQAYQFIDGKPEIFAPSADLFPYESLGNDLHILSSEKIGSHYKVNSPAWEYLTNWFKRIY